LQGHSVFFVKNCRTELLTGFTPLVPQILGEIKENLFCYSRLQRKWL